MRTRLIRVEHMNSGGTGVHLAPIDTQGESALERYSPRNGDWIVLNPDGTYEEFVVADPKPAKRITRKTRA